MMLGQAGCRAVPRWTWARSRDASTAISLRRATASVGQQHFPHYSVSTSHSIREPPWRYEVDNYVRKIAAEVEAGSRTSTTAITLNTARPVTPDLCREVLMHVYRKVVALRICFRERDEQLWVADMDTPKIDFQVVEGSSVEDVAKITSHSAYNTAEGPLWRARLVVCPPDEPCMLPHIKKPFPYQCQLVIDMHHAVYDGLCNMVILQIFIKTLDSVLDGTQIDESQVGELRDRSEIRALEARIKESLEKDKHRLKGLLEERYKIQTRVPLIIEAFGEPKGSLLKTNTLTPEILDHKFLEMFSAKCKAHKVTFNSAFSGIMMVALMELVREAGIVRDSYNISTLHAINTRRYMSNVTSMVWGFHGMPMTLDMAMPWDARKNFWKHVVDIDTKLRERIRKIGPLEDLVLDTMLKPMLTERRYKIIYDMLLTNVWTSTIPTIGNEKHVHMTHFLGYTSLDDLDWKITCGLFGFKNWVQSQLAYSSEYITNENAVKLSERMTMLFNDTAASKD